MLITAPLNLSQMISDCDVNNSIIMIRALFSDIILYIDRIAIITEKYIPNNHYI